MGKLHIGFPGEVIMANELDQQSVYRAEKRLKEVMEGSDIVAALLSTSRGRALAWESSLESLLPADVAMMANYTSNMGNLLTHGKDAKRYNRVVCDVKGNPVIITSVGQLLLTLVGDEHANIGKVVGIAEHIASEFGCTLTLRPESGRVTSEGAGRERIRQQSGSDRFVFDADGFTQRVLADIEARKGHTAGV